ncbi:hypothetical protein ABKN59_009877 [Abortiporus biennis]
MHALSLQLYASGPYSCSHVQIFSVGFVRHLSVSVSIIASRSHPSSFELPLHIIRRFEPRHANSLTLPLDYLIASNATYNGTDQPSILAYISVNGGCRAAPQDLCVVLYTESDLHWCLTQARFLCQRSMIILYDPSLF